MSDCKTIDHRLNALPAKVSFPIRQLLKVGQLDAATLSYVLDAGDLTGETTKLIGFAIGFLHLRSHGVPVHDVISMAKQQGRSINLDWSANRWKQEHDRLSRAEAMQRLADENVVYTLDDYDALLPTTFDGYLIRTSRRLGLEGLRQHHCVASYHPQLVAGRCAIASLIVDQQRWTVHLVKTDEPDGPLRIQQIRSKHNGLPTEAVREAIGSMLGIPVARSVSTNRDVDERGYLNTLQAILPTLQDHGVTSVVVTFDGQGDSGAIENLWVQPSAASAVKDVEITYNTIRPLFEDGRWIRVTEAVRSSLADAIEALTYDYLEETDVDWYNNDGGFGELLINVANQTVSLEVNVRYTEYTTAYNRERNIVTGEDL